MTGCLTVRIVVLCTAVAAGDLLLCRRHCCCHASILSCQFSPHRPHPSAFHLFCAQNPARKQSAPPLTPTPSSVCCLLPCLTCFVRTHPPCPVRRILTLRMRSSLRASCTLPLGVSVTKNSASTHAKHMQVLVLCAFPDLHPLPCPCYWSTRLIGWAAHEHS